MVLLYLLLHEVYYERLRQEVDANFLRGEDPIDQERLAGMDILNVCISETLRLAPRSQRILTRGSSHG